MTQIALALFSHHR